MSDKVLIAYASKCGSTGEEVPEGDFRDGQPT